MNGLTEAKKLYTERGARMLHERFPEYEGRIAVGLVGRGSQCFGYDDIISRDHDFSNGFCLFLTDEDDAKIGVALSRAYRELVGADETERSALGSSGTGVMRISDFYRQTIGLACAPSAWQDWLYTPSTAFAEAVNGEVFRDDLGQFSRIRNEIANGMPEDVQRKKLAARLIFMAQSGQYNYSRCLGHNELGAAILALSEFVKNAAECVFLLNRRHAPYYKWLLRAMRELPRLGSLADALEFLLTAENNDEGAKLKAEVIEDICAQIVAELRAQRLTCGSWDYLEPHAFDVQSHIENREIRSLHIMEG